MLVFNYLISIGLVYRLKQHKIQKLRNFGRMAGFCLRACPFQNTQRRITLTPSARPAPSEAVPRVPSPAPNPSKTPSLGKHRQLQHDHSGIFEVTSQRASLCPPCILNLLAHNSMCSTGVWLLSQSCPGTFTVASGNLLLQPLPASPPHSQLIKSLCVKGISN